MKAHFRTVAIQFAIAILLLTLCLTASVFAGDDRYRGRSEQQKALSAEQATQITSILQQYDADSLTSDDAKAIHRAFREAGLRGGPATNDAVRAVGFDPERIRDLDPPPDRPQAAEQSAVRRPSQEEKQGGGYSIEQAISNRAQLHTIAFNGLAFFTGDFCSDTFIPPGKVSDFFGFQYMRDIDSGELGHNTSYLPRIANNLLYVLNDAQKQKLITLAKEQAPQIRTLALKRFPLIKAYRRLLEDDLPSGSAGLDKAAVQSYTAEMFELDGLLAYRRAEVLGSIVRSLNARQKAYLGKLSFDNSNTWPQLRDQVDKRSMSHEVHVAVMTYASEMFSWYAGSVDADTYFCPERHGTYFGGFYMKDMPAMGNPGYSISTSLTGNSGEQMLATLNVSQRSLITGIVDIQSNALNEVVRVRRAISTELRRFITVGTADRSLVLSLARHYGELDGEMAHLYATRFAKVYRTLTSAQQAKLRQLRNLDKYQCRGAYLYSDNISLPQHLDTDFFFGTATQ